MSVKHAEKKTRATASTVNRSFCKSRFPTEPMALRALRCPCRGCRVRRTVALSTDRSGTGTGPGTGAGTGTGTGAGTGAGTGTGTGAGTGGI